MVRFGGPGTAKQCCVHRKCLAPVLPSAPAAGGAAGGGRPAGSGEVELEAAELIYEGDEAGWSDDEAMVIVDAVEVDDVTEPGAGGWGSKRARTDV